MYGEQPKYFQTFEINHWFTPLIAKMYCTYVEYVILIPEQMLPYGMGLLWDSLKDFKVMLRFWASAHYIF